MAFPIIPQVASMSLLPAQARGDVVWLKRCLVVLWALAVLDFLVNPFHGFCTLLLATMGTALLSEEDGVAPCFNFLNTHFLPRGCATGVAILVPFLFMCDSYALLDGMDLINKLNANGVNALRSPVLCIFACVVVCELVAAILTWRIVRTVMPSIPEPGDYQQLAGQPFDAVRSPAGTQSEPILPFSGQAHNLV